MGIKASNKEYSIRSRYLVKQQIFSDIFYDLHEGYDQQQHTEIFILKVHQQLVSPKFVDFCVERLVPYLYLSIPGLFELTDYEFNGSDFFIIYKASTESLLTLDLYLNNVQKKSNYSALAYSIVQQILSILYSIENKQIVFGCLSLNNVFVSDNGRVLLGPAMLHLIFIEFYIDKLDVFEDSIFLAPEFIKSFEISTKIDIYSFGVLAFYIYTMQWPYNHSQSLIKLKLLFNDGPQEPVSFNKKLSDQLNYFILKSIQLNIDERWNSFYLLIEFLEGRDVGSFDRLSNQFIDRAMFDSDLVTHKRNKIAKFFNRVFMLVVIVALGFSSVMIYNSYFLKYDVVKVPSLESLNVDEAVIQLENLDLYPNIVQYNYHPFIEEDAVIRVDPPSGRVIKQGRKVMLYVSKGKQELMVPVLIGKHKSELDIILGNFNIDIEYSQSQYSFDYEEGHIISQIPQPNQYMFDNGIIQVVLSKGVPIEFDVLKLEDDYITLNFTFNLVDKNDMQHIEIFDNLDGLNNILYSDYHYFGDTITRQFRIHKEAAIIIYRDSKLLIKKQFTDEDFNNL